jgi:F-type H+-transporting ATPase subunit delta
MAAFAASAVSAPEVLSALSWLSYRAQTHHPDEELSLVGHMAARRRIGGYATAVFEEADTAGLEEVEDQLFRFARIVEATPALVAELTDREVPVKVRQDIVSELLNGRVEPATLRLARFVVVGGRARDFVGALDWLVERTAEARGWRVARVRAAEPVDVAQRQQLADALSALSGAPVELQVTVDPDLLSGVVVGIGDLQVDASARGRLDRLREELLPTGSERAGGQDRTRGQQ